MVTAYMGKQTITQAIFRKHVYDGEELFRYYHSLGRAATWSKLREHAKELGMVDPETGEPSRMGPRFAMWRWALRNPDKAWEYYEPWAKEYESVLIAKGVEINKQNFLEDIKQHTKPPGKSEKGAVGRRHYLAFCKKYGLDPEIQLHPGEM